MSFRKWLRHIRRHAQSFTHEQHRSNLTGRLRWTPQLETLEIRLVPANLTVTNLNDSGTGSLRAEIAAANTGDTIQFGSLHGTLTLTSGELALAKSITIQGPGVSVLSISGNHATRVFEVVRGVTDSISGVTITNGQTTSSYGGGILVDGGGTLTLTSSTLSGNSANYGEGGGILNYGTLTLTSSTLSGNSAYDYGGGIYNYGTLTLTSSTLSGNSAGYGGGIYNYGTLTLTSSTLSGNSAGYGGGIYNYGTLTLTSSTLSGNSAYGGGGIYNYGTLTLTSSTLSGNSDSRFSGGIYLNSGTVSLRNTIVAGNLSGSSSSDLQGGTVNPNSSYNLIGTGGAGGLTNGTNHNLVGVADAKLGTLANNGGPTQTMATLTGSPAIGAGDPALAGTTDQRGVTRGAPVSIGAYQAPTTATAVRASTSTAVYGTSVTFTATVTSGSNPVTTGTVTFTEGLTTLGTVNVNSSGQAAYSTSTLNVAGSPHTITATYNPNGSYQTSSGSAMLTVTRAPLTITADAKTKVYGSANPALTASYSGFVNGDTAAVVSGLRLSTTATTGSGVGNYPITASGASAANYTISYTAGTLTVTKAPLTITADSKTKVYGSANPTLTASYSGFVNGDTAAVVSGLRLSTTATTGSGVGNYPITASGASAANYTISYVAGTLTVTKAPLTITAAGKTKVYGSANPTLTATYNGFVNGDTAATALTGALATTATASSPVGTYPITQGTLAAANYTISFTGANLTVTKAPLTITADNKTKVAGNSVPTLTARYNGLVNGDTSAVVSGLTLSTYTGNTAGSYNIIPSGATAANYTITFVNGTLTVTPAAASTFTVSGFPSSTTTGVAHNFTVTAQDAYSNTATGYTGTVHFTSSDAQANLPMNSTLTSGTGTFSATLNTAGTQSLTATDTTTATITGSQTGITVTATPPQVTAANDQSATEGSSGTFALGSFTDPNSAPYTVDVNWGDGTPDTTFTMQNAGTITAQAHTYAEEGGNTVTVTVTNSASQSDTQTFTITAADAAVSATGGFTVQAATVTDSGLQTVATFTDPGGAEDLVDYSAAIDWGDGSQASTGTITFDPNSGTYTVQGNHTYADEGGYVITVTLSHDLAADATVTSMANVVAASVVPTGGFTVGNGVVEDADTGMVTVATFTDPHGSEDVSQYSAQIDWGGFGLVTTGTITYDPNSDSFSVTGDITYLDEGTYTITVTISHRTAADAATTSTAVIADAPLAPGNGSTITATTGQDTGVQALATFTDTDPGVQEDVADYAAQIDWGDGGQPSAGTIVANDDGSFTVLGNYTYAQSGTYTITLTIMHDSADPITMMAEADVTDGPAGGPRVSARMAAVDQVFLPNQVALLLGDHSPRAAFPAAPPTAGGLNTATALAMSDHHGLQWMDRGSAARAVVSARVSHQLAPRESLSDGIPGFSKGDDKDSIDLI